MKKFIPVAEPLLRKNEMRYVCDCIRNNWISSAGYYVKRFEEEFSKFCGVKFAIAVSNGTAALHLSLLVSGIGPGDEVIIPALTFIATANAVAYTGAKPVLVDSDKTTWNIDPSKIEEKITRRTKAIIPVHLYGCPCDMDHILKLAKKYNLKIIEDAAEAHGAVYKGRKVGSIGSLGCFSFYANKIITTGEGGMVVTNDKKLASQIRNLSNHGMSETRRYWHPRIGYNYRITNLQAAVGLAQLENIKTIIRIKLRNAGYYENLLSRINGLTLPPKVTSAKNVYWMYSILIEDKFGLSRNEVMDALARAGIETRPFFYPINTMPPYQDKEKFPVAKELSWKGVNLPSSVKLTLSEIKFIVNTVKQLTRNPKRY